MNAARWVDIVTPALRGYTVLADAVSDTWHRSVLPVVPLPRPAAR